VLAIFFNVQFTNGKRLERRPEADAPKKKPQRSREKTESAGVLEPALYE
jgi:hypothetical protein